MTTSIDLRNVHAAPLRVETTPVTTKIPLITVNDPFDEPLLIELFPNYDTASATFTPASS